MDERENLTVKYSEYLKNNVVVDVKYKDGYLEMTDDEGQIHKLDTNQLCGMCDSSIEDHIDIIDLHAKADKDTTYSVGIADPETAITANCAGIANASNYTTSAILADNTVAAHTYTADGIYQPTTTNGIYYPPNPDYSTVLTYPPTPTITVSASPIKTQYFIEKSENFSWIASKFSKFYINEVSTMRQPGWKIPEVKIFGIANGIPTFLVIKLDALSESIKEFFTKAANQARVCKFTELFGPISEEANMQTYVRKIEEDGVFIKELYDDEYLLNLVKKGSLKLNGRIINGDKTTEGGMVDEDDEDDSWFSPNPFFDKPENEKDVPEEVKGKDQDKDRANPFGTSNPFDSLWNNPDTFRVHDDITYTRDATAAWTAFTASTPLNNNANVTSSTSYSISGIASGKSIAAN